MEKLSLEKFQDSEIEKKQLAFVHAGDTCTGGGFRNYWTVGSNGEPCCWMTKTYESDSTDECGHTTFYNVQTTMDTSCL